MLQGLEGYGGLEYPRTDLYVHPTVIVDKAAQVLKVALGDHFNGLLSLD